jgi:hypothetical protein
MDIDPLVPLVLIPWDQLFKNFSGKEHIITLTAPMGSALDEFRNDTTKALVYGSSKVEPSCFYDNCLNYEDYELEQTYESVKKLLSGRFQVFGTQQWVFGNRFLLKEFEKFFKPEEVQYLEPSNIIIPYTLFLSEENGKLMFSYIKTPEEFICFQ